MDLSFLSRPRLDREFAVGKPDKSYKDARDLILLPYSTRAAHMHAIGLTRSGKSRFLADLIRQDILNGFGVCVVDPHAELVNLTVDWLMKNPAVVDLTPQIHVVRVGDIGTTFKYNPLALDHPDEAYSVASNVSAAITRMFGGINPTETPRFWFVIDVMCTILALQGLPLAALKYMTLDTALGRELRTRICEGVHDPYFRELGQEMAMLKGKEFREKVESTLHRMHPFLRNPAIERMFSTTENTANFRQMMDEGHVFLLDTSDETKKVNFAETRLYGMFVVNNIFSASRGRETYERPQPFFTYIDECQNYLSHDIEDILSQAAKRGLYLTLSHQHLGQLVEAGQVIFDSVMAGARLKAVFQTTAQDSEVLVDELFAQEVDFERVKEKLKTPHVVGNQIRTLKGKSKTTASGKSEAHADIYTQTESEIASWGDSSGRSDGLGENAHVGTSVFVPENVAFDPSGQTMIEGFGTNAIHLETYSSTKGGAHGSAYSRGTADTIGWNKQEAVGESENETLEPVYEWFSTTTYSLEDQRYELRKNLSHQPDRHGYLAVRREGTLGFTTRTVEDPLNLPEVKKGFLERENARSEWIAKAEDVPRVLEQPKMIELLQHPRRREHPTQEPDDYFEPDE